jgi:hypothetical protein
MVKHRNDQDDFHNQQQKIKQNKRENESVESE